MGIFKKMALTWKSMTTLEKINIVIDAVTGLGCGMGSAALGKQMTKGSNIIEKVCVNTAMAGLGLAAADVSSKALKDNYAPLAAGLIDRAKGITAQAKENKEEAAHE